MKEINKRAFTLIELLAVIIILAVIALIATPIVLDVVESAKRSAFESTAYGMVDAMKLKSAEDMIEGNSMTKEYDFSVDKLDIQGDQLNGLGSVDNEGRIAIAVNNGKWCATKGYSEGTITVKEYVEGECTLPVEGNNDPVVYKDNSGANVPDLLDNMIPVHYIDANEDGTYEWVYADITKEWYNYTAKEWANAVVLNSGVTKSIGDTILESEIALWYVWIPRYTYTIFNGNNESVAAQVIDITFEPGTASNGTVSCVDVDFTQNPTSTVSETCTDTTNGSIVNGTSTYTHPAFNFGGVPLTGFWVGKFEISGTTTTEGAIDTLTIKPNVDSLREQTVSAFFTAIQNMSTTYNLNGDSHMMKNMEWGAVAYLKQSEYGLGTTDIGINNYYDSTNKVYKTGCGVAATTIGSSRTCNAYNTETGMLASTTGNVYGVYDMSGGADEYTMGNMVDSNGAFYSSNAGFTAETTPDSKYYDAYAYDLLSYTTHARGKLGDATKETLATFGSTSGGWTSDSTAFQFYSYSWFERGGGYTSGTGAGVFYFNSRNGTAYSPNSARAVLVR